MGGGTYSARAFENYAVTNGYTYDYTTHRVSGHRYKQNHLKDFLNAKGKIRECCNSDEHPNTVPVILALDVTALIIGGATTVEITDGIALIAGVIAAVALVIAFIAERVKK